MWSDSIAKSGVVSFSIYVPYISNVHDLVYMTCSTLFLRLCVSISIPFLTITLHPWVKSYWFWFSLANLCSFLQEFISLFEKHELYLHGYFTHTPWAWFLWDCGSTWIMFRTSLVLVLFLVEPCLWSLTFLSGWKVNVFVFCFVLFCLRTNKSNKFSNHFVL